MSHPEWVRGLKHEKSHVEVGKLVSHPEWVRGLKHAKYKTSFRYFGRTPSGCVD